MNNRKPDPIFEPVVHGRICPICGKRSYSREGVHPQCSVRQADAPRQAALAEEKRKSRLLTAANCDSAASHR